MTWVTACPECGEALTAHNNRRFWCDGGRRAGPDERWICRDCGATFPTPTRRRSKKLAGRLEG